MAHRNVAWTVAPFGPIRGRLSEGRRSKRRVVPELCDPIERSPAGARPECFSRASQKRPCKRPRRGCATTGLVAQSVKVAGLSRYQPGPSSKRRVPVGAPARPTRRRVCQNAQTRKADRRAEGQTRSLLLAALPRRPQAEDRSATSRVALLGPTSRRPAPLHETDKKDRQKGPTNRARRMGSTVTKRPLKWVRKPTKGPSPGPVDIVQRSPLRGRRGASEERASQGPCGTVEVPRDCKRKRPGPVQRRTLSPAGPAPCRTVPTGP
ncbi:hypothetical protein M885DRAFT_132339 [Pelagophyceae sp. CCMP2097]|nr:hypothetical protein M885DRAFT_132339 [Pelagophyceae sp. CCMP2097]